MRPNELASYHIDVQRGFLPPEDPLLRLPPAYDLWEQVAVELPALLMTRRLRSLLAGLPPLGTTGLESEAMLDRAMLLLSVLGNAYIWGEKDPAQVLPPGVAIPWWQVAAAVGRPPILSHASMVLQNWRRLNADEPVSLNNLATLQLFLGGLDESWFYLVTVAIEAEGGAAIAAMSAALEAAETHNLDEVTHNLELMAKALECMVDTLRRMPEQCDPYVFFHRIRPFLASWPETGVVYEGVDERPYRFAGGSAAQSSLLQALDAGLGIRHNSPFLREMRDYMPPPHHRFIEALTSGPSLRDYFLENKGSYPGLVAWYNTCIHLLDSFRQTHLEYSVRYISHQAAHDQQKSVQGTGGTDFVPLLSQIRKETRNAALMGASHLAR